MLGKKVNILLLTLLTLLSTAVSAAVNTQYSTTVCGSGTYLFGCQKLTSSGTETNTLGDSTVTLHLLFAPLKATSYTATIEPGQTYLFGCQRLKADAVTSNTLQQIGCGCDSTVTLTLKVQAPAPAIDTVKVQYDAAIKTGETYLFGCVQLTASGTYSDTLHLAGKDSIVFVNLTVAPAPAIDTVKVQYDAAIKTGETYLFGCVQLTASGTYSDTLHLAGKDSIVFVNLTVAPAPVIEVKVQYDAAIKTGETYLFGCAQLTASGTYSDTLHLAGKDSIVFVNLTVAPAIDTVKVQYDAAIKTGETYLFGCAQLTASGTYSDTLHLAGKDSIVFVNLTVAPAIDTVKVQYDAAIKTGETYLFGCAQLTASGTYSDTLHLAGKDSIVFVNLTVAPAIDTVKVQYDAAIKTGETYLFGCAQLTASGTYSDTLHLAGKDSIVFVNLTVAPAIDTVKVQYDAAIKTGETYLFGCAQLTASGTYSDTLHLAGKDSIVFVNLTVAPAIDTVKVQYDAAIKTGETYLFGCAQLTASGTYSDTLHLAGKDSIVFVNLTVAPAIDTVKVQYDAAIKTGETYLFGCAQLTASGTYSDTLHLAGKDSIVFVNLTVAPAIDTVKVQYNTEITVGDIYLFGCKTYQYTETGSQVLTDTLHLAGKDSIVFVNLTVSAGGGGQGDTAVAYTATIKPGQTYLFGCQQLTSPGTYYDTLPRVNLIGDSAIVLTLVNEVKVGYDATIKQGETYLFGCQQFTVDTVYADTLHMAGKDSITVLTLTVEPVCPAVIVVGDTAAAVCEKDLPFIWHGLTLNADTVCEDTLHNATALGCDSIARLTFTVIKPVTGNDSIEGCDSVTYKGITYKASAIAYDTTTSVLTGCDSIVTMKIIVKQHAIGNDSIEGCDTVTFKGIKYTADAIVYDTIIGGATNGCDSIVTMKIIVKQHATGDDAMDGCDTVTFKGIKYTADAIVYDTIVGGAANGCDSIVTMTITVHHTDSSTLDSIDTCNMYTWHGVRYTKTGIYYDTLQTVHGCDSICKLDLTITLPYQDTLTLEHYYGDRVIMINRHEINALGWKLDSLDLDHPEYVKWYRIEASGDTTYLRPDGYYYTMPNGEPLPAGTYFAVIKIEPGEGARCGGRGVTKEYTVKGAAPAPALMPSLARPGQDIRIVNLNPMVQTNVRIYSADGLVQGSYTVSGEESYTIKAAGTTGFYLVELYNEDMKSTLRYIVK